MLGFSCLLSHMNYPLHDASRSLLLNFMSRNAEIFAPVADLKCNRK